MRRAVTLLLSALLIVACSKTPEPPKPPVDAALPSGSAADAAALVKALETDRSRFLREFSQVDYAVQRRLLEISGVEAELGGPQAADAALRALMKELERIVAMPQPRWQPIDTSNQVDGALGVAASLVELAGLTMGLEELYGDGVPKHTGRNTEHGKNRIDIENGKVSYQSETAATAGGLTGRFTTLMKVNACPDAAGKLNLDFTTQSNISSSNAGANTTIRVQLTRTVNDDAEYDGIESTTHVEAASYGANAASFVDLDTGVSTTDGAANGTTVNRRGERTTDADVKNARDLADMLYRFGITFAELIADVWKGGACVKLEPTSDPAKRAGVQPSTQFSITAAPRSKIDATPTGGTVRATLSGGSSLQPNGTPVKADAKFEYVAPDEKDKSASIAFESRSRRGIGKGTLEFDTKKPKAYSIEGGAGEFHGSGVACGLDSEFVVRGSGVTVTFTPSGSEGGTYRYTGNMSGFSVWGDGTYTVIYRDSTAVSISASGPGHVEGGASASGSETYTLTPYEGDCGG